MPRRRSSWLLSTLAIAAIGCATTRSHWEAAQSRDSIDAYSEFLAYHPDSEFSTEARARRQQLEDDRDCPQVWLRARLMNTVPGYQEVLRRYPNVPEAPQARQQIALLRALAGAGNVVIRETCAEGRNDPSAPKDDTSQLEFAGIARRYLQHAGLRVMGTDDEPDGADLVVAITWSVSHGYEPVQYMPGPGYPLTAVKGTLVLSRAGEALLRKTFSAKDTGSVQIVAGGSMNTGLVNPVVSHPVWPKVSELDPVWTQGGFAPALLDMVGKAWGLNALIAALTDDDRNTRSCAGEALQQATGQELPATHAAWTRWSRELKSPRAHRP